MMSLIITACLATHPGVCRTWDVPLTVEVDQNMCQFIGQIEMAKPGGWQDQHKGWVVRDYKCAELVDFPNKRARAL